MANLHKAKSGQDWNEESLGLFISELVGKESGNVLGPGQQSMVVSRLKKRMIDLGIESPEVYFQYLQDNLKAETSQLVSLLTTHHTFFFREFCHFEYLLKNLDSIVSQVKKRGDKKIRFLSAACSRGHEVYSLGSFLEVHLKKYPDIDYEILGTDIDPLSVKICQNGVYPFKEVSSIPSLYLNGNWQRGTGDIAQFARVKSEIKNKCKFFAMNLLDCKETLKGSKFDVIFCRNVFIYFDKLTIESIVSHLVNNLFEDGLLITGLSESLNDLKIKKISLAPSVYSFNLKAKTENTAIESKTSGQSVKPGMSLVKPSQNTDSISIPKPIKILAVDDSASIIKLMQKIFSNDPDFELVGTAANGKEAEEFLKAHKVDAMTLDIHMPEMNGVEYLQKNFKSGHPHVVMVSSASREDSRFSLAALEAGAADFVEKPALNNLAEKADEIKLKLKLAFFNQGSAKKINTSLHTDYKIENCDKKLRIFVTTYGDRQKTLQTIKSLSGYKGQNPPSIVLLDGGNQFFDQFKKELDQLGPTKLLQNGQSLEINGVYFADFGTSFDSLKTSLTNRYTVICCFGLTTKKVSDWILSLNEVDLLLEDITAQSNHLKDVATDLFPWTSFAHVSTELLAKKSLK